MLQGTARYSAPGSTMWEEEQNKLRGKCGDEALGEVGRKGVGLTDENTLCMSYSDNTLKNEQNT